MRIRLRGSIARWLFVAVLGAAPQPSAPEALSGPLAPEMLPPGDPSWEDLYRLELAGGLPVGTTAMRPVARGEIASWIAGIPVAEAIDPASLLRLRRAFARELRRLGHEAGEGETPALILLSGPEDREDSLSLDGARSEVRIGPSASLQIRDRDGRGEFGDSTRIGIYGVALFARVGAIQGELFAGEVEKGRSFADPLVKDTDLIYHLEEAGAAFSSSPLRMRIARGRRHWGVGWGRSLLLDQRAPPVTAFEWEISLPRAIRFRSWAGSLNFREERGIAAHRLEIPIGSWLRVALSEGVRYMGGPAHPLYLGGLLPYTLVQRLDWQDVREDSLRMAQRNNVLADLEIIWRPREASLAYLELLVDDVPATSGRSPARLGGRVGLAAMPELWGRRCELGIEATKVSRYTYAVSYRDRCECNWIHQEQALGEPDGPDQEALRFRGGRSIGRDHRLEASALWANLGSARLGEAFDERGARDESTRQALELRPPIERRRAIEFLWRYEPRDNLSLDLAGSVIWIRNAGNRPGAGYDPGFRLELRARWRR